MNDQREQWFSDIVQEFYDSQKGVYARRMVAVVFGKPRSDIFAGLFDETATRDVTLYNRVWDFVCVHKISIAELRVYRLRIKNCQTMAKHGADYALGFLVFSGLMSGFIATGFWPFPNIFRIVVAGVLGFLSLVQIAHSWHLRDHQIALECADGVVVTAIENLWESAKEP